MASTQMLQYNFQQQKAMRQQFLMNPAISGFTNSQLNNALGFAFGSGSGGMDPLSTLGGVGLENMGLYGLGGLTDQNIVGQGNSLFQIGLALGGPNSLANQLNQKANMAAYQQGQQQITQYGQAYQKLVLQARFKQQLGIPLSIQDYLQIQQISQAVQQIQLTQAQAYQTIMGAPTGYGGLGNNPMSSLFGGLGNGFGSSLLSGAGVNAFGGYGQASGFGQSLFGI